MRRVLGLVVLVVIALCGFYLAWPAWTAWQIRQAIEANDPAALERKIDFARVRRRVKPLIAAELSRSVEQAGETGGLGALISGQLQAGLSGTLADAAVEAILTPENVIRLVHQGKTLRRALKDVAMAGRVKKPDSGGIKGTEPVTGETSGARPRRLGLANIKSYRITGPLTLSVGISRDAQSAAPDVTAELAFTGFDWKVVGLVPHVWL